MLEMEQQAESVYAGQEQVEELSPLDRFRQQWEQQPGPIPLIKQKNVVDQNAELVPYAGMAAVEGWSRPISFAFQGLVVAALVLSFANWLMTRDSGPLHDDIIALHDNVQTEVQRQQGIMDATDAEISRISHARAETFVLRMADHPLSRQEALQQLNATLEDTRRSLDEFKARSAAREKDLRARMAAMAMANSGTPLVFTLALVFASGGIRRSIQRHYSRNRFARNAGDFYLYFATAQGMYLNLVFLVLLHCALSASNYGLTELFESGGPLLSALFWAGFYALLLWYFGRIARDMYKALELRAPGAQWSPENKMLLRIHNSFLLLFVEIEIPFLAGCYLLYRLG